jgi:septal ring factor EnvC (AmiA/AmiB activator)
LPAWNISQSNAGFGKSKTDIHSVCRLKFETAQLATTRERLQRLRASVEKERQNLEEKLQSDLETMQGEIQQAEEEIEELRSDLETFEADVSEKSAAVDVARKAFNKASRALDEVSKDVSGWVRRSPRTALKRLTILPYYRKMKLKACLRSATLSTENAGWRTSSYLWKILAEPWQTSRSLR